LRDLFLVCFLPYLVFLVFQRPFIGAALWIWSALLSPHRWVWGFAGSIRYNFLFAIVSFASYALYRHRPKMAWSGLATLIMIFYLWMSISTLLAISDTGTPFREWDIFTRVIALAVFCHMVMENKLHLDVFIWAMVIVLGGYGMLEGSKYLLSGLSHSVRGIGGTDRNHLALFLVMVIPLAAYLRSQVVSRLLRLGLLVMIGIVAVAVIGTLSRGGLITLFGTGVGYLLISGRRFIPAAIAIAAFAFALTFVMTDEVVERARTIQTADQDNSFAARTMAWKMSLYIALDNPVFGGGPYAVQSYDVWSKYVNRFDPDEFWETPDVSDDYKAAHSIYFQVLGDTGFVGFFIYMTMLGFGLISSLRIAAAGRARSDTGLLQLGQGLFLSLVALMIGGAALSVAYYDQVFATLALISVASARLKRGTLLATSPNREQKPQRITRSGPGNSLARADRT
jgi:probable O-glycosylation ligase (exosortase A-associated)